MAQHARLEEARLVMERRRSRRPAEAGRRVTLQTQQVHVAQLQHVWIRSAMHQVAGLAAINFHRLMLEHKRSLLVCVAREADLILRRRGAHLLRPHRAVRIVAVRALHQALVHAVVERHVEFRLLRQVAGIAELGLGLHQHEIRVLPVVRRMAGNATDLVLGMFGVDGVHMLSAAGVAAQATRINFFGRGFLEEEELGRIRWIGYVARGGAVAILAAVLGDATFFVCLLPVRTFLPAIVNVCMARLAALRTHIRRWTGILRSRRDC
jgi:hypothetical protein